MATVSLNRPEKLNSFDGRMHEELHDGLDSTAANDDPAASCCRVKAGEVLRGGEQEARRIEGHYHGPFPEEDRPEVVAGKDLILVATNGTRAIADATPTEKILLGCLPNARRSPIIWKGRGRIRCT